MNKNSKAAAADRDQTGGGDLDLDDALEEAQDDLKNQPDIDESAEKDVLTDLPVEGAKRALLRKLLEPIVDQVRCRFPLIRLLTCTRLRPGLFKANKAIHAHYVSLGTLTM